MDLGWEAWMGPATTTPKRMGCRGATLVDIQKHAFVGVPDGEKGVADGLRIKAVTIEELGCPGWPLAALGR
jgi:hypothetical protein